MMYWKWHGIARTGAVVVAVYAAKKPIRAQFITGLSPVGMRDVVTVVWHGLMLVSTAMMAVVTVNMDLGW